MIHSASMRLITQAPIIITARVLGYICQKVGLPTVIGEIAAGIILGPSFLATQFPAEAAPMTIAGAGIVTLVCVPE